MTTSPNIAEIVDEAISTLAWINGQAKSAMTLASGSSGAADDLNMLASIASDISINAELLSDLLAHHHLANQGEKL